MNLNQIRNTNKTGRTATRTSTLYLRVAPGGSKSWVQRITINGKRRNLGLGSVAKISYAAASKKAMANILAVYEGRDVLAELRAAKLPTFNETVKATYQAQRARWSAESSANKWLGLLKNHVPAASLGELRIDKITGHDLLPVLLRVHKAAPDSARRLRQCMALVFAHAIAKGYRTDNPAVLVAGAMPKRAKRSEQHHATIGYAKVPASFKALESCENRAARLVLRFLTLTAVRSTEARGATWSEIDLAAKVWTIPASRMKTAVEHRIPLSAAALAILREAEALQDGSGLVFPSPYRRGGMVNEKLLIKALRASTDVSGATVHGQRAAFQTWAAETGQRAELAEAALAHAKGQVTAAYQRSDLLEQRRALMERWAGFVTGQRAKVVSIEAA